MAVTNNNLKMIDRPVWEQLTSLPAATAAGGCFVDDGKRFIYYLASGTAFWRYDTWTDTWMQLANCLGGTMTVGALRYVTEVGGQYNGEVFGSIYALVCTGAAVTFSKYDIATNAWAALSVTNVPAAFGTDARIVCPEPALNGFAGGYHGTTSLQTVTTSAQALAGATTLAVSALPLALPAGAVLNFGTAAAPLWAVLTAAAAAAATSLTVAPLIATINSASTALWYADMYLFGNNATVVYRYNIASNAWALTSSNSGNPALVAVTAALGAGHVVAWLPGSYDATLNPNALNTLYIFRGTASGTVYAYRLDTNTISTVTMKPDTETFTTGTGSGVRVNSSGKNEKLVIQKDITGRFFEYDFKRGRVESAMTQNLYNSGAALLGDKCAILKDPSGAVEFIYLALSTSTVFLRCPFLT